VLKKKERERIREKVKSDLFTVFTINMMLFTYRLSRSHWLILM